MPRRPYDPRQIRNPPPLARPMDAAEIARPDPNALRGIQPASPFRRPRDAASINPPDPRTLEGIQNPQPLVRPQDQAEIVQLDPSRLEHIRSDAKRRIPIELAAGVMRPGTPYKAAGMWYDSDLVRWYEGVLQPIGGRLVLPLTARTQGPCRGSHAWRHQEIIAGVLTTSTRMYSYRLNQTVQNLTPGNDLAASESWQIDNYGNDALLVSLADERLWHLPDITGVPDHLANSPNCIGVVVTPESFIVALGATPIGSGVRQDRHIRWADVNDPTVWTPIASGADFNLAGDKDITTAGRILAGKRTKGETLIWTETDLHTMRYVGGTAVYRVDSAGETSVISRRAMEVVDSRAYWMGERNFYIYTGTVQKLACTVADYVFDSINETQSYKIWCDVRSQFSEVTWFYPRGMSTECNAYVTFNYKEGIWYFGNMTRSGGFNRLFSYPILVDDSGETFQHESVFTAYDSQLPSAETGVLKLGDGTDKMFIDRIYPDGRSEGDVQYFILASNENLEDEVAYGPYLGTEIAKPRITARQIRFRVLHNSGRWRFGVPRLRMTRAGSRDS